MTKGKTKKSHSCEGRKLKNGYWNKASMTKGKRRRIKISGLGVTYSYL
jgi:hypothetical protein